ncbi:unnamed protein product [Brassicogethes aeneus]|uniref:Uncharacterized protein n=1 Tax=Brassicogethes aeneus TaxID=1431903 RepID=A0A9P0BK33_BRAAE|nr:unnamed protein product [Brassicogethes aeneus]
MGVFKYYCFLFTCAIFRVDSRDLPPFLKACSISDPKLNVCALKNANEALPSLFKANKKLGIPAFDPYLLPLLEIQTSNFLIKLDNVKFYGLNDARVKAINVNLKDSIWSADVEMDRVNLVGHYIASGNIASFPIRGDGISNTTFVGGLYKYTVHMPKRMKDGVEYFSINSTSLTFKLKRAHFYHGNLFNGNQQLGDALNNFFNENWELILEEMGDAIKKTIQAIGTSVVSKIVDNVPANKIFLP